MCGWLFCSQRQGRTFVLNISVDLCALNPLMSLSFIFCANFEGANFTDRLNGSFGCLEMVLNCIYLQMYVLLVTHCPAEFRVYMTTMY